MMTRKNRTIVRGLGVTLLSVLCLGCAPTARIGTQHVDLPGKYANQPTGDSTTSARVEWREFFQDTILQGYIVRALENNRSFRNTLERITLAQHELRLRKGAMLPSVWAGVGADLQRSGAYTRDGAGDGLPDPYREFSIGVGFQWEVDIWRKLNSRKKAAVSRWMASSEVAQMAQTILISELANRYFELVGLDRQRAILEQAIQSTEVSCNFTDALKEEGEVTQLAVDQFAARLLDLKGSLLENERRIKSGERAICLLMGVLPQAIARIEFDALDKSTFAVALGVPTQLLALRPDIKNAELELAATRYDVEAAHKAFFPSLTLGGSVGFNAYAISQWFVAPSSLAYNLALGLTAPIFNRNELKVMWNNANTYQRIALNDYHNTILKAYDEVTGLIIESELTRRHQELQRAEVKVSENAIMAANDLFRLQFIGYLEVLAADREYIASQLGYADLIIHYCQTQSNLYRALGGGVF